MANILYPILTCVNAAFAVLQFIINGFAAQGPDGTLFLRSTTDVSNFFRTAATPSGWTFSIWGFIYTWQALWIVYSLANICRRGPKGPAYADPMFLPLPLFVITIILCCLNITWLITFDRLEIEVSCAVLIAYALLMYAAMVISYRALDQASSALVSQKRTLEIWLTRGLVHNGLGIQATWVTAATLLNMAMVMSYSGDRLVSLSAAGTAILSILLVLILLFASTDLLLLDRYTRYTITPYIVLVVALSGILTNNYEEGERNSIYTVVLLSLAALLLLLKILITIFRHLKRERYVCDVERTIALEDKSGPQA